MKLETCTRSISEKEWPCTILRNLFPNATKAIHSSSTVALLDVLSHPLVPPLVHQVGVDAGLVEAGALAAAAHHAHRVRPAA